MENFPFTTTESLQRVIGTYTSGNPGPAIVGIGGMHGNEPAGVLALQRILGHLADNSLPIKGHFTGLIGNLSAIKAGKRFISRDLNRMWDNLSGAELSGSLSESEVELAEMRELHQHIAAKTVSSEGGTYIIDLHTTSSRSRPFLIMDANPGSKSLAAHFPIPKVYGMDKYIPGTLSACLAREGHTALNFEAGHHDDPQSPLKHEAMLWLAMVAVGMVDRSQVPGYDALVSILTGADTIDACEYEIVYRHPVTPGAHFLMLPGFDNFSPVTAGQSLAQTEGRMVTSPIDARIFMPLYQPQGNDGFFLVEKVG